MIFDRVDSTSALEAMSGDVLSPSRSASTAGEEVPKFPVPVKTALPSLTPFSGRLLCRGVGRDEP
jgi:hypothetical protein